MVAAIRLRRRLFLIPLITFIFVILSFIVTYAIAVALGHVELVFPYISYTGINLPERGVFGQLINVGAMLLAMNVYLRFLRLEAYCRVNKKLSRLNAIGLVMGLISSFGISMVANFETVVMRAPHYVGAGLAFGVGVPYCWVQTYMSYRQRQRRFLRNVFICQAINAFIMSVFAIAFATSKAIYLVNKVDETSKYQEGIRDAYLTSTVSEWLLAVSFMTFLLTYIPEYLKVQLTGPFLMESEDRHCLTRDGQNHSGENGTEANGLTYDESSADTPISA